MRINLDWLREWVALDATGHELAAELTSSGLEVDAVEDLAADIDNVVIARVETVEPHPEADRLRVCTVNDGSAVHDVVCGAPNVAPGVLVPFARVGARLPGGVKIKASKLRGVKSNGMLCSGKELGIPDDVDGLLMLDEDAPLGESIVEYLRLPDAVLDIDLTPNRGDCFSVIGIAREAAAKHQLPLHGPDISTVPARTQHTLSVELRAGAACPRFAGRVVEEVANDRQSPLWLRERLRRAGLRAINPVVDVTNYVMLELGQPLHAYDLDLLQGGIDVRLGRVGEEIALLNEKQVTLTEDVLVIADQRGAIGLAGIMGGASTGTSVTTSRVFFESAFFAPSAIAGRARAYGLHTDASVRFERGVDPAGQERAIERATSLLVQIAGGSPGPTRVAELADSVPHTPPIRLRHARIEKLLGCAIERRDVELMLNRLGLELRPDREGWQVSPPSYRFDLTIEEDLIEEVGRMRGYDSIPVTPASVAARLGRKSEALVTQEAVGDCLIERGYHEVVTYTFVDDALDSKFSPGGVSITLANPIASDMSVMRRSLWPGLVSAARKNFAHQMDDIRLFEIGPQFDDSLGQTGVVAGLATGSAWPEQWSATSRELDFYDVKGDVETLLQIGGAGGSYRFEAASHPALRPGQTARVCRASETVGWIGAIHPRLQKELDLKQAVYLFALRSDALLAGRIPKFAAYSRLPFIRRDIAVVVDEALEAQVLVDAVRNCAGDLLQDVIVFDVYRGKGIDATRKSVALGLILHDASRTLTDDDADGVVRSVTQILARDTGATIRT